MNESVVNRVGDVFLWQPLHPRRVHLHKSQVILVLPSYNDTSIVKGKRESGILEWYAARRLLFFSSRDTGISFKVFVLSLVQSCLNGIGHKPRGGQAFMLDNRELRLHEMFLSPVKDSWLKLLSTRWCSWDALKPFTLKQPRVCLYGIQHGLYETVTNFRNNTSIISSYWIHL